jgi:uncharacterized protein with GYD domain
MAMSHYILLCTYTDQGIRKIKDVPKRRAEAQEIGKKLDVEVKAGFSAMGAYDLILHVEAPSDDALSKWALSIASRGNIRTNTIKVYPAAEFDTIIAGIV